MNYLHNKDLYIEIVVSKAQGKLTKEAKDMLEMLGKRIIKKMHYWNNDDRLDCYQGGLLQMYANWHNFNPDKADGNAFAYFTEICKRGICQSFNELYKKRGDPTHLIKLISLEGSNDGQGLHSI